MIRGPARRTAPLRAGRVGKARRGSRAATRTGRWTPCVHGGHNLTVFVKSRLACCSLLLFVLALLSTPGGASSPGAGGTSGARSETAVAASCALEQALAAGSTAVPGRRCPFSQTEYAAMCEPELGRVPKVACDDGVLIPITVDGIEVFEDPGNHACDNPDGLRGGCAPGSRLGHVEGRDADGNPLPQVSWVYFCRSVGPENLERYGWGSVQLIGYNRQVGRDLLLRSRRRPEVAARGSSRELRDPGSEALGLVRRAPHWWVRCPDPTTRTSTTLSCRRPRPT